MELVRFPDKTRGGDLFAHSPTLKHTNPPFLNTKICQTIGWFFFFFSCALLNGDALLHREKWALLRQTWANMTGRFFPPLSRSQPQSQIRRGDKSPQAFNSERGSNVWHWDTAWQSCVWPQSTSLFNAVWERERFLFIRRGPGGRWGRLQHYKRWPSCMTCLSVKNHLLEVMYSDSHLNPSSFHLSPLYSTLH